MAEKASGAAVKEALSTKTVLELLEEDDEFEVSYCEASVHRQRFCWFQRKTTLLDVQSELILIKLQLFQEFEGANWEHDFGKEAEDGQLWQDDWDDDDINDNFTQQLRQQIELTAASTNASAQASS